MDFMLCSMETGKVVGLSCRPGREDSLRQCAARWDATASNVAREVLTEYLKRFDVMHPHVSQAMPPVVQPSPHYCVREPERAVVEIEQLAADNALPDEITAARKVIKYAEEE